MLVLPGALTNLISKRSDPILALPNMQHYSDPEKSVKTFHSGDALSSIQPLKGSLALQQTDPDFAMVFDPNSFDGLGGYRFPQNNRWMMYDAEPWPFQAGRTLGIVFELEGGLSNNLIFGYAKYNSFNTSWRVQTNTQNGGRLTFGRDLTGGFPVIYPSNATPKRFIMTVRQLSINAHEFYINSTSNPIVIDPRDDYYTSNRVRLMLGRVGSYKSEMAATIGPIFDCMEVVSISKIEEIMKFWSSRIGITLNI